MNGLLSQAAELLTDSRPSSEEEQKAEQIALDHICEAGMIVARGRRKQGAGSTNA